MKRDLLHTPEGVRDIYNSECAKKLVLMNRLHDVCIKYGFNDIQTPSIEFFDIFSKERGSVPSNEMFKLFDRYGNTLVLRPDMTPAIARTAAKYFSENVLPLKLCYSGNTFINVSKSYQGKLKENTTIGAELIGDDSLDADYEMISMVIDCMKNAGLKEFQVEIGNVMYFKGLLNEAGINDEDEEQLITLLQEKNYFGVDEFLHSHNIDDKVSEVLLKLPQMFGSVDILSEAKNAVSNKICIEAIDRLLSLYELLKTTGYDKYVSFDIGAVSSHAYYTGIIFKAYTFGTGEAVVTGGRYDKLIGQFGCDKASIGFSITVDSLMAAITRQKLNIPLDISGVLLIYKSSNLIKAIDISNKLRGMDLNTSIIAYSDNITISQYIDYALNSQLEYVLLLDNATNNLINVKTGKSETIKLNDILGGKLS